MRVSLFGFGAYIHVAVCLGTLVQSKRLDASDPDKDIEVKISDAGRVTIVDGGDVKLHGTVKKITVELDGGRGNLEVHGEFWEADGPGGFKIVLDSGKKEELVRRARLVHMLEAGGGLRNHSERGVALQNRAQSREPATPDAAEPLSPPRPPLHTYDTMRDGDRKQPE